jgi:hypothetical protein
MAKILIGRKLTRATDSVTSFEANKLITEPFDAIDMFSKNAAGDPLVIKYYQGGLAGTLIATLTITYDGDGDLKTVVRT